MQPANRRNRGALIGFGMILFMIGVGVYAIPLILCIVISLPYTVLDGDFGVFCVLWGLFCAIMSDSSSEEPFDNHNRCQRLDA